MLLAYMISPESLTKAEKDRLLEGYASALNITFEEADKILHNIVEKKNF